VSGPADAMDTLASLRKMVGNTSVDSVSVVQGRRLQLKRQSLKSACNILVSRAESA